MSYDTKSFGASPFGNSPKETQYEPLSDQGEPPAQAAEETPTQPNLPTGDTPPLKTKKKGLPLSYLPRGQLTGLSLAGEAAGWLMGWGTVGFFRSYIPKPALTLLDQVLSPWGLSGLLLISALILGRQLERHRRKIAALRQLATTAIEYGQAHHKADAQTEIDTLLRQAEACAESASRLLVSLLTALGCLHIIGAFY